MARAFRAEVLDVAELADTDPHQQHTEQWRQRRRLVHSATNNLNTKTGTRFNIQTNVKYGAMLFFLG